MATAVLPWGRKAETWDQIAWFEDPLGCTGRESSPSWSAFGRGSMASRGSKELVDTSVLPCSLA